MGTISNAADKLMKSVTRSIRHFTAFLLLLFLGGLMVGAQIAQTNQSLLSSVTIVIAFLAIVSYFYTEAAIVFFLIFALIFIFF